MKQKYRIETVTPIHIGSGETLNHIDGYYVNGRWYRIDLERVLAHPSTDLNALTSDMGSRDFRWERYLSQRNLDPVELSIYSLLCPQSPETGEIQEVVRTPQNQPFIPGSTLKGAIRTALLREILSEDDSIYEQSQGYLKSLVDQKPRGNPRREYPSRRIEGTVFGKDPNHDLLRALLVSDTAPIDCDCLEIGITWTVTLDYNNQLTQKIDDRHNYRNFIQQIQARQQLVFTLKVDELLFREREKTELNFNSLQERKLRDIAEVCRSDADELMKAEQEFFEYYGCPEIANRYDQLIRLNAYLPKGGFLLQIGAGSGYHAKTAAELLISDTESPDDLWMELRHRFRLGESRSRRGHYDDREFPKTRRILYHGQNPVEPLGWIKILPVET